MKPAVRISFGIVALTICLLLTADSLLGIFPDPNAPLIEARKSLSESLGRQYAVLVNQTQPRQLLDAMEATVAQTPDVLSMALRAEGGRLLAVTRKHDQLWKNAQTDRSTPTHVRVPLFRGEKRWGNLEVRFVKLRSDGILGLLNAPLYKLIMVMAAAGFALYMLYLRRTLRYLDPSTVVPGRVRAALDQLVEGAFILDQNQRMVLVNSAFAEKVGRTPDSLLGVDPSSLDWVVGDAQSRAPELPWVAAKRDGARHTDVRLELESPTLGVRVLTANVSPVVDGGGKQRGVLATFDDISDTERMNRELQETIGRLEVAQAEVQSRNEELFRLATVDPLTGSLNRRALFEKLELEFDVARRDGPQLSVVMADIDHFKSINDDFGHAVGDAVIKDMADVLAESCGVNGCVGRYGGEEFCLALVATDAGAAVETAERARLAFEDRSKASGSPTAGRKVTASFGIAALDSGTTDLAELLSQSDQALYASKDGGRNRVTSWADMAPPQRKAV